MNELEKGHILSASEKVYRYAEGRLAGIQQLFITTSRKAWKCNDPKELSCAEYVAAMAIEQASVIRSHRAR